MSPLADAMTEAATLRAARGVIADTPQHDDTTVANACEVVTKQSRDPEERASANNLLTMIKGERA